MKVYYLGALVLTSALVLVACGQRDEFSDMPQPGQVALVNAGFEDPVGANTISGWNPFQHAGESSYQMEIDTVESGDGKQSFRMTQTLPQFYGMIEQRVMLTPDMVGKVLEFSAMAKTRDVGPDGWTIWINLYDGVDTLLGHVVSAPLLGTTQWQRIVVSGTVPTRTTHVTVGVQMTDTGNHGVGWLDDARLRVIEPDESARAQP